MRALLWAALAALVLAALWRLCLRGRRDHPAWAELERFRYAHRGLHGHGVPENSLAAFRLAAEGGFGAELDVHLTKDKRLAVIHDSSLRRTCGAEGTVEDMTAAELATFRLEGTEERIPFLEEVLPLFEGKAPLIVELKCAGGNAGELAERTCRMLEAHHTNYCIESFDPRALMWLKGHRPQVVRGQLTQNFLRRGEGLSWPVRFVLTSLLGNALTRPDFVACRFEDRGDAPVRLCCRRGVRQVDWTIRSPEQQRRAEQEGHLVIFEGYAPRDEKGETA